MRYDGIMNRWTLRRWVLNVTLVGVLLVGCDGAAKTVVPDATNDSPSPTSNPALLATLQAGLAQTAAWIGSLTAPANYPPTEIPALAPVSTGTPLAERSGVCPVPDGFAVYQREGFCISTPSTWLVFNVDGGMAAFLNTTPGQSISVQPDWANDAAVCHLLIFITAHRDVAEYLAASRDQIGSRTDLAILSPVAQQSLGDTGLYGFTWGDNAGNQGSVYAASLGPNRLVHVSLGGSNCPVDVMTPAIDTLRVN